MFTITYTAHTVIYMYIYTIVRFCMLPCEWELGDAVQEGKGRVGHRKFRFRSVLLLLAVQSFLSALPISHSPFNDTNPLLFLLSLLSPLFRALPFQVA